MYCNSYDYWHDRRLLCSRSDKMTDIWLLRTITIAVCMLIAGFILGGYLGSKPKTCYMIAIKGMQIPACESGHVDRRMFADGI